MIVDFDKDNSRQTYIKWVGFALFLGIFFNFIYDILKHFGFNSPEWFWYVGIALETTILYLILYRVLGRNVVTRVALAVMGGVLIKEIIGIPLEINFIEYPTIVVLYFYEKYLHRKNKKNEN